MMWMLKKNGFYLYIAGCVIIVAAPLIIFGAGGIGLMAAGGNALVGAIFIAMYAANLKQMS
jgi:hypothetical protein